MKSHIYISLAFLIFFFTGLFLLRQYIDTRLYNAPLCSHVHVVEMHKTGSNTWNGKNAIGQDKSCYVDWNLHGKSYRSERWNIGNCIDVTPIYMDVVDYECH